MTDIAERRPIGTIRSEAEATAGAGLDHVPRTELVRLLAAARAEYLATHGRFLTGEEFEREWARERGAERDAEE